MGQGGLEPPTPRLSSVCSNQLSYWPSKPPRFPGQEIHPDKASERISPWGYAPQAAGPQRISLIRGAIPTEEPNRGSPKQGRMRGQCLPHALRHRTSPTQSIQSIWQEYSVRGPSPSATPSRADTRKQASSSSGRSSIRRHQRIPKDPNQQASLKGGDPAAGSPTATLLRLHPSH